MITLPSVDKVREGIWSIPIPIPDNPLRYALCYAVETTVGPVLVDPGWPDESAWATLVDGLQVAGWTPRDVHGVLVTHAHSDHHGLAARVRSASGCWIGMHEADARMLRGLADGSLVEERNEQWFGACGVPESERNSGFQFTPQRVQEFSDLEPDIWIADGADDLLTGRRAVAIWTPGHTPGHLCFVLADDEVVITGDHLLPRISPHISSYDRQGADPLGLYLGSLERLSELPGITTHEVLPGHEYRFRGLQARVDAILGHHQGRLSEVRECVAAAPGVTVWEVARAITWSRGWEETTGSRRRLAVAETLAHLRWLESRMLLRAVSGRPERWTSI